MPDPMPWGQLVLALWPIWLVLGMLVSCWAVDWWARRPRVCRTPCCTSCAGHGVGGVAMVESHGGACWDCMGTGHPHAPETRYATAR